MLGSSYYLTFSSHSLPEHIERALFVGDLVPMGVWLGPVAHPEVRIGPKAVVVKIGDVEGSRIQDGDVARPEEGRDGW